MLKQQTKMKMNPPNNPNPYKVTDKWGTQLKLERGGSKTIYREAERVKKYDPNPKVDYRDKQLDENQGTLE